MPWSNEQVGEIIQHLGPVPVLWLLIMHRGDGYAGIRVGPGAARNAVKLYSKVRSYARDHGIDPPPDENEVKQAYSRLLRVDITHPELGTDSVILGSKPDYLQLTDVGRRLVTRIHTDEELKECAKSEAGIGEDAGPEPDWPDEYDDEEAMVVLTPTEVVSDLNPPFELPTHAQFTCPVCSAMVEHEYTFTYPDHAWGQYVDTTCPDCEAVLEHEYGNPFSEIDVIER